MPGIDHGSARRRRRVLEDDSDDDDGSDNSAASNGSKRVRLSREATSELDNDDTTSTLASQTPAPIPPNLPARQNGLSKAKGRDPDVFQPGSVVRMKLVNFVTYTEAEFHLGPNLNMIIGPNGTGKSTFVCAVCVGLGWPATTMGRAKEVGEYVKKGTEEAVIEIELAATANMRRNPVIRREISKDTSKKRDGSTSNWFINDRKVPQKDVDDLVRGKLSIQIDNLCQFLPQDRVVEFSGLTPVELLRETLEATASQQMQQWHQELKVLDKQQQDQGVHRDQDKVKLNELQTKQANQRGDVERIVERRELGERLIALEKFRCMVEYRDAVEFVKSRREQHKQRKKDLERLKKEVEPSLRAVRDKEQSLAKVDRWHNQRQKQADRWEVTIADELKKHEAVQKKIEECDNSITAEYQTNKKRNAEIKRVEGVINNLKVQQEQEPPEFDAAEYNRRIRATQREIDEVAERAREISQEQVSLQSQARELRDVRENAERSLQRLKTQAGQQAARLRQLSQDTARAWEWVQENQDRFEGKVFGPPIVECSVKDSRYASALESIFGRNDLLAFTVTNARDRNTLSDALTGRDGMKMVDITIKNAGDRGLNSWQPPCSKGQLQSYGLDGWASDFLEGPDPVLSVLCDFNGLHRTAFGLQKHDDAQFAAIRDSEIISRWADIDTSYSVTRRREYGPNAVSTATRPLMPSKYWKAEGQTGQSDMDRNLRTERDEATEKIEQLKQQNDALKTEIQTLKTSKNKLEARKEELSGEKDAKQRSLADWRAIPVKLGAQQATLKGLYEQQGEWLTIVNSIQTKKDRLCLEKAQAAKNHADHVSNLFKALVEVQEAALWSIEVSSDLEVVTEKNIEAKISLQDAERDVLTLGKETDEAKRKAKVLLSEVQGMMEARTDSEREIQDTFDVNIPVEQLIAEIETTANRLGLLSDGDPRLVQDYEERARLIERLEEKLRKSDSDIQDLKDKIGDIRAQWEPQLDELVDSISSAFSDNFSRIGCAGQVEVYKDERFENWSIRIQVKFRDNEPLSALTSQRQSGGERSVSTMLYLLSLHAQSRAPFRIVDEINQGMDPRNERMMHERIVDISCEESHSQYFLVTPKLLTDLKFHPRMKVHFIQSGDWMPAKSKVLNPMNSLAIMRQLAVKA